ncbi:MAG TPA: nucleotidyltransferase family protein [Candidatus Lokiarchaeia archaeon]|nr:nucleotidyltransferase family protein [Candidatus Lokiarchaeia archaeon]
MELSQAPVVIMAGGLGTRIREKVPGVPKPMIPFAGKPFLYYKVAQLQEAGFKKLILTIGYLGEKIQEYFGDGSDLDLEIEYSIEIEPLGTGGGLKQVASLISSPFFMINADTYYELDWQDVGNFYATAGTPHLMMLTRPVNPGQEGTVVLDEEGTIVEFAEKAPDYQDKLINGGVYLLDPAIFEQIPEGKCSIEKNIFPLLAEERSMKGYFYDGYFIDIGTPDFYEKFQRDIKSRRLKQFK